MEETLAYNALATALESNYHALAELKHRFGTWKSAWDEARTQYPRLNAEEEWGKLGRSGVRLVLFGDALYPPLLKEIPLPPFGMYVRGDLPPHDGFLIAIVGTRKATAEGRRLTYDFSLSLARSGVAVVSGLAFGIDAAAHEGCLAARGKTVAVLANGLDRFYPRTHEQLTKKILTEGGALVSEYPLGTPPLPYRFLERNRIVSGLSRGVLIVEAPRGSGALATARFATEQNRDVFVIPGPATHPNFAGSHALIRAGAELVTSPEEMLQSFGIEEKQGENAASPESAEEEIILEAFGGSAEPLNVDKIVELTNLNAQTVNQLLTFLMMKNLVEESGGGYTLTTNKFQR